MLTKKNYFPKNLMIQSSVFPQKLLAFILSDSSNITIKASRFANLDLNTALLINMMGVDKVGSLQIESSIFESIVQSKSSLAPSILIKDTKTSVSIYNNTFTKILTCKKSFLKNFYL